MNAEDALAADDVLLDLPVNAPDLALTPVALVFAQCLALLASLKLGITPDNPSASGTVTRVVSGVIIHPLAAAAPDRPEPAPRLSQRRAPRLAPASPRPPTSPMIRS